jgi:hypothetical protein
MTMTPEERAELLHDRVLMRGMDEDHIAIIAAAIRAAENDALERAARVFIFDEGAITAIRNLKHPA